MTVSYSNADATHLRIVGYWQMRTLISPKNHLPADSIGSFLQDFMLKFNCFFEFDSNNNVYLHKGDFMTIDRELTDIHPEIIIENTLDTGITLAYDFPSDKQYDNIKKVNEMTAYLGTEKVFAAGFNDMVLVPIRDTFPNPLPVDDYYGMLYEDCNQIGFAIKDTPMFDESLSIPWIFPSHFYIDNVLPVTLGVYTRPDSPTVNQKNAVPDNTNSYTLKYPPISHINNDVSNWTRQTPYKMPNAVITYITDTFIVPDHDTLGGSPQHWTIGMGINAFAPIGLVIPVGAVIRYDALIPTGVTVSGGFFAYGTVNSYNNDTGALVFTITSMAIQETYPFTILTDDGYFIGSGGEYFTWNNWSVTIAMSANEAGGGAYMPAPIMAAKVSTFGTQDYLMTPTYAYAYTYALFDHAWAFNALYTGSSGWVLVPIGSAANSANNTPPAILMPLAWTTRDTTIFEMGFYWGLQAAYTDNLSYTGSGIDDLHAPFVGSHTFTRLIYGGGDFLIPTLTGYERIYGNIDIIPGWFNLSLFGSYSLLAQFWKGFINQYLNNRKITITVYEPINITRGHKWHRSVSILGTKVYISEINSKLPYRYDGIEYIGYLI